MIETKDVGCLAMEGVVHGMEEGVHGVTGQVVVEDGVLDCSER